jgi:nucleoid DNA-binding protein
MTKAELVTQVAQETQLTQHQSAAIVERFLQCIIEALQAGDTVELRGFGRFRCRHRRARQGRNPKTGVPVAIPAQTVPVFTVGKALHVRLNPGLPPGHH